MRFSVFWRSREIAWRGAVFGEDGSPTKAGEVILNHLADLCFLDKSTEGETPQETSYNNGMRQVGLDIMKVLKQDWAAIYELEEEESDG